MKYNVSEITELIRDRRTIKPKDYTDRVVQRDMLERIMSNGTWAPNHGMTQPWRFKVFTGESRVDLSEFLSGLYERTTDKEKFLNRKFNNLKESPLKSSVVIAICMERQESGKISKQDEMLAVACCVQNMYLTCTAYGLGSFWATPGIIHEPGMKEFLSLGPEDECLGLFYIGYPAIEWPKGYRTPLAEMVEWKEE